jgi:hypothetical protein
LKLKKSSGETLNRNQGPQRRRRRRRSGRRRSRRIYSYSTIL